MGKLSLLCLPFEVLLLFKMHLPSGQVCLALGAVGITSHLTYFIRMGMTPLPVPRLVFSALAAPFVLPIIASFLLRIDPIQAVVTAWIWWSSYLIGLLASMVTYRLFFHPLRRFKGPFLSKISQFYHLSQIYPRVDHYRKIDDLHREYGEFVRVGPNLLSVSDVDIVNAVHAPLTKFNKGSWYQAGYPMTTLHQ
jgi:cytochrome P450 family 628